MASSSPKLPKAVKSSKSSQKSRTPKQPEQINLATATPEEVQRKITAMQKGGKILGNLLQDLKHHVRPGMTGLELDAWVRAEIIKRGAGVAYDMLEDKFPGAICISVNDALVHGAPSAEPLEPGSKVSFDLDIYYNGFFTDSAFTMIVPDYDGRPAKSSPAVKKMLEVTESALWQGITEVRPGARIGDISAAVEKVLRKGHLGVIENYIGHGIGLTMHEAPEVPNYGRRHTGYRLVEGDTICIEPMASLGKPANHTDDTDGWTVRMNDGSIGCHCEHTILVTHSGYEILTLPS